MRNVVTVPLSDLLRLAKPRAASAVACLLIRLDAAGTSLETDSPQLQLDFKRALDTCGGYNRSAARLGIGAEELRDLSTAIDDLVRTEGAASREASFDRRADHAIACLRLCRLSRCALPAAMSGNRFSWPRLEAPDPRRTPLSACVRALELLLRKLVSHCHGSGQELSDYLFRSPVLARRRASLGGVITLDRVYLSELVDTLLDQYHSAKLADVFERADVLGFRSRPHKTLRIFLKDVCDLRNQLDHAKEVELGEESLHLYGLQARKIAALIQGATFAGVLADDVVVQHVLLSEYLTEPDHRKYSNARAVQVAPKRRLDAATGQKLRELQRRTAAAMNAGSPELTIQIGNRTLVFRIVPDAAADVGQGFFMSARALTAPDGGVSLDAAQVNRWLEKAAIARPAVRLPTSEELTWALAPYARLARDNPFGLIDPAIDGAHWVHDPPGPMRLVALPGGGNDPRLTGRLCLVRAATKVRA